MIRDRALAVCLVLVAVFVVLLAQIDTSPPVAIQDEAVGGEPSGRADVKQDRHTDTRRRADGREPKQVVATVNDDSQEEKPEDDGFNWKETIAVVFGFLGLLLVYGQLLATQESNRITQESNELSHRPWMIPDTISEIEPAGKGLLDLPTIKIMQTFKNAGSTPAVIIGGVVSTAVFPPGRRENLVQMHEDIPSEAGDCICPPGGEFQLPITVHVPSDEVLGMILASQLTFLIYGRVNYRDVFGKSRFTRWGMEFGHGFGAKWAEPRWITAGGDYNEIN